MLKREKRGLSTVIVTLILILVSLVAVGIVWLVVRNVIQTGTEGVGLTQFSLNAKIMDVSINNNSNTVNLTVKRNAGQGDLTGISFVFSSDADTEVVTRNISLKELEEKKFNFSLTKFNVLNLISISIIPLIKQDGKEISGIALDKYTLGKNQNTQSEQTTCTPSTCASLGYNCGNWNDGCSGTLGCGVFGNGSCQTGFSCNSTGGCVASGNYVYALSCSQTDVQNAVNSANRGNTIIVPAGNCIWTSTLTITKGITFEGAGIKSTNITSIGNSIIQYNPDNIARTNNEKFEVSGFSFDCNTTGGYNGAVDIDNYNNVVVSNMVIHNNRFNRCMKGLYIEGNVWGVAYNNIFDTNGMFIMVLGNSRDSWDNHSVSYGNSENFFLEDNIMIGNWFLDSGHGGRYEVRYNIMDSHPGLQLFDMHGNQGSGIYSEMIGEIYGNFITNATRPGGQELLEQRGGQALVFNNRISAVGSNWWIYVVDEIDDALDPCNSCIQHPTNSYYFNNIVNNNVLLNAEKKSVSLPTVAENSEFFNYNPSCTSASCPAGIGCGSTPPIGTCNTGVGYWVTSYSPCYSAPSTMDEMKTVTQSGRFYKCTAPNTWTLYYTPYTYPHPLTLT